MAATTQPRRNIDPVMIAAAAMSGPQITRNHFLHGFRDHSPAGDHTTHSQQAPRSLRLARARAEAEANGSFHQEDVAIDRATLSRAEARAASTVAQVTDASFVDATDGAHDADCACLHHRRTSVALPDPPVAAAAPHATVQCKVRTRIPTPHGEILVYLYHNSVDDKEHMAFVADRAQLRALDNATPAPKGQPFIRSASLDAQWSQNETETDRIIRGAYVGKLSAEHVVPTVPAAPEASAEGSRTKSEVPMASIEGTKATETPSNEAEGNPSDPPLVRIHSECFTGETVGSQRCDCGEQLDEAFRLIALSGYGVVVYLRQEGRGIGLLEKLRAYNLQDLGHDTVTANLLLGHGADLRTYGVARAILHDLGIPSVRLLTNNPDKIHQIEKEGIVVAERVPMVPRVWQKAESPSRDSASDTDSVRHAESLRNSGVGMIGASVTQSQELDKYLRTKIERMGHMLDVPDV